MHSSKTYLIFWEPPHLSDGSTSPTTNYSAYNATIKQYFQDIATSPSSLYGIATQYGDTTNGNISGTLTYGGYFTDTTGEAFGLSNSYPTSGCSDSALGTPSNCLSESQIETEIKYITGANSITPDMNTDFIVYTDDGEGSAITISGTTSYAYSPFCGYHDSFSYSSNPYIFAQIPYTETNVTGDGIGSSTIPCDLFSSITTPTSTIIDSAISWSSHEHFEMMTDPDPEGNLGYGIAWADQTGNYEIGDLCDGEVPSQLLLDGGNADVEINGHYYMVQEEYSNNLSACTLVSPHQVNDTIYAVQFPSGLGGSANLVAYNTSDGSNKWTQPCSVCAYDEFAVDSKRGWVYGINSGEIVQLDAGSGSPTGTTFSIDSGYSYKEVAPVIYNGIVYTSAEKSDYTGTYGKVYAYKSDGSSFWSSALSISGKSAYINAYGGGYLFAVSTDMQSIYKINANTGSLVWTYTIPDGTATTTSDTPGSNGLTYANGVLYYPSIKHVGSTYTYYVNALDVSGSSTPTSDKWEKTVPDELFFGLRLTAPVHTLLKRIPLQAMIWFME